MQNAHRKIIIKQDMRSEKEYDILNIMEFDRNNVSPSPSHD